MANPNTEIKFKPTSEQPITAEDIIGLKKMLEPRYIVLTSNCKVYDELVKEYGENCVILTKLVNGTMLVDMWRVREINFKSFPKQTV